jgi:hypothetical protein
MAIWEGGTLKKIFNILFHNAFSILTNRFFRDSLLGF